MAARYWRRVIARAWSKTLQRGTYWRAYLGGGAVISFLVGSLFFWWLQGWDKVTEEWAVWVAYSLGAGALLFIGTFVNNLYRAPPEMELEVLDKINELKERVNILESAQEQVLVFEFKKEDNKYLEHKDFQEGGHYRKYKVGRVAVKNMSETKSVFGVRTTLINYRNDGYDKYNTVDIMLSSYSTSKYVDDIPSRRNITYDLFRVRTGKNQSSIELGPWPDGSYKKISSGRYKLKVTASSVDLPPSSTFYLLDVNKDGVVTYGPYGQDKSSHIIL